ncbi:hypothetical protein QE392_000201 [Microbacterium proteolyticum]|nr:hypothetical protein [Microbacterium sp. SORGH_AS_0344]MDQ1168397.1 hypothetical protein [Microbacterium proteolyticum]
MWTICRHLPCEFAGVGLKLRQLAVERLGGDHHARVNEKCHSRVLCQCYRGLFDRRVPAVAQRRVSHGAAVDPPETRQARRGARLRATSNLRANVPSVCPPPRGPRLPQNHAVGGAFVTRSRASVATFRQHLLSVGPRRAPWQRRPSRRRRGRRRCRASHASPGRGRHGLWAGGRRSPAPRHPRRNAPERARRRDRQPSNLWPILPYPALASAPASTAASTTGAAFGFVSTGNTFYGFDPRVVARATGVVGVCPRRARILTGDWCRIAP